MPEPKQIEIIARGLILDRGWALLCRNTAKGYYYLPGGHVEPGEPAKQALERELVEEANLQIEAGECAFICECCFQQEGKARHELNMVFHVEPPRSCRSPDGAEHTGIPAEILSCEDGIEFEWIELATLTDIDFRPLVIRAWVVSGCDLGDINRPGWMSISE